MIGIVIPYYNRKQLLENTLMSIAHSTCKNYILYIVDDGSNKEHQLDRCWLSNWSDLNIRLFSIAPKHKRWFFEVIPANIGIARAMLECDKIVLQNPECVHLSDVLCYVEGELGLDEWVAMPTVAINDTLTRELEVHLREATSSYLCQDMIAHATSKSSWYSHPKYRPKPYHFCAAASRDVFQQIGGFDERYILDCAYADDDLLRRLNRAGINTRWAENQLVVHQYHTEMTYSRSPFNGTKNKELFAQLSNESVIDASAYMSVSRNMPVEEMIL